MGNDIEKRIAKIIEDHYLWDGYTDSDGTVARCRCDLDNPSITNGVEDGGWMTQNDYYAHVAAVLVAELGLRQEWAPDLQGGSRYVTDWQDDT